MHYISKRHIELRERALAFVLLFIGAIALLIPLAYMIGGAFGSKQTARLVPPSIIPLESRQVETENGKSFLFRMDIEGQEREMAVAERKGETWTFFEPSNPGKTWDLPASAAKDRVLVPTFHPENFALAAKKIPMGQYVLNTLAMMLVITLGALVSNVLVAYGFSRFRMRGMNVLFLIMLATIMLPSQVVLIPSFVMFYSIGWYNTWLPLIVPAFFANAWNVFLIRQFMMGLPKELDESARMDGCGPIKTLIHILLPQMKPILITVTLFTVIYVWNEFFNSLIYLKDRELFPVSLGIQTFSALHSSDAYLGNALSVMLAIPPVLIFFFAQRYFIQGTVVTGVKG